MLIKLDTKTARVKGLSFHNRQPWILVSLHTGLIQLWDYRSSLNLETFEEHSGPVRSANFHTRQPLFVSGGDDYKVKVWNYKSTKSLFTLIGHYDYVRITTFHKNHPWIASCSDDQSIKIWNWQSRGCLSTLTGHNHYVMCVEFHPREDLLLSASLDQTIRIWDLAGLKYSNTAVCKTILNGHSSGVNWASFHQYLGLIVSGGDDFLVKLWRFDDDKAWEVNTLRSHHKNVTSVIFYKNQDMVLSVSEDKTLRIWDLITKSCVYTHRRMHDRFWILAEHPEQNVFAAGHDAGLMVFKFEKERTVNCIAQNCMYYVKDKTIRKYSFESGKDVQILSIINSHWNKSIRCISVNEGISLILITFEIKSGNFFELRDLKEGRTYLYACGIVAKFISAKVYAVVENNKQLTLNYINKFDVNKVSTGIGCDFIFTDPFEKILITRNDERINCYKYNDESVLDLTSNDKEDKADNHNQVISLYRNNLEVERFSQGTSSSKKDSDVGLISRNIDGASSFYEPTLCSENATVTDNCDKNRNSKNRNNMPVINLLQNDANTIALNILRNSNNLTFENPDETAKASQSTHSLCSVKVLKPAKPLILMGKTKIKKCKFIKWSPNHVNVVLMNRDQLAFCEYKFQVQATIKERNKIKSGAWDGNSCFVYTTTHHLKYSLITGQTGIIRTLDVPVYIVKVDKGKIHCFDTNGRIKIFNVDTTEYLFKLALLTKNKAEILEVFKNRKLVGQSIISYLDQNGFTNIALHFVKDPSTTFHLSVKIGKFQVALKAAYSLNSQNIWLTLAAEALKWGCMDIAEVSYKESGCLDKLLFLYLITGNFKRMRRLLGTSLQNVNESKRNELNSLNASRNYHFGLLLGDVQLRIKSLVDSGQSNLAYITADLHGCTDLVSGDANTAKFGKTGESIKIGDGGSAQAQGRFQKASVDASKISFQNARRVFSSEKVGHFKQAGDFKLAGASRSEMFGIQVDKRRAKFLRSPPPIQKLQNWPLININSV